jgi:pimeloyl-ACP methyl ester carboxylesterase
MNLPLAPPARSLLLKETRAASDMVRMALRLLRRRHEAIDTAPVMLLPGFGADEHAMRPLQRLLTRHGVHAEQWGLGRNLAGLNIDHRLEDISPSWQLDPLPRYRREAGMPLVCDRLIERVRERSEALGSKLTLIGWSLGGTMAREVAREIPEHVEQLITLGSPVVGGPKYTAAASRMKRKGLDLDWIERQVERRLQTPIQVPITAIISPADAIVGFGAAWDRTSPKVQHLEIDAAHLGMAFNPEIWDLILKTLQRSPMNPRPAA